MNPNVFCPNCGTANQGTASVCEKCATTLPTIVRAAPPMPPPVAIKKKGFSWVTVVFIALGFFPLLPLEPWWLIGCWVLAYMSYKNGWGK